MIEPNYGLTPFKDDPFQGLRDGFPHRLALKAGVDTGPDGQCRLFQLLAQPEELLCARNRIGQGVLSVDNDRSRKIRGPNR